ncbi:MAG: Spx/MgsR family RNA polymerase-binding regulatory protein [Symploca sp. SIO2G7]|nr:Spx/MgsR family RNA polymerase-binding regulatory protein [Symploca sp. SIO2G7]
MSNAVNIFGIQSCDTCRKALKWLAANGIENRWVDIRVDGLDSARVSRWLEILGAEQLVNRRSTTWRQLAAEDRPALDSDDWADVLLAHPTLIKRPVFEVDGEFRVGFSDDVRAWLVG